MSPRCKSIRGASAPPKGGLHSMAKKASKKIHYQGEKGAQFTQELKNLDLTRVLIVPIDVAKHSHKALTANYFGDIYDSPFEFANNRSGLDKFLSVVESASEKHECQKVIVAAEPTGRYHEPVFRALTDRGYDVRLVNVYSVAAYRKADMNWVKTDERDLNAIGQVVVNNQTLHRSVSVSVYSNLQTASRARMQDIRARSVVKCQIKDICDRLLPGLTDSRVFPIFWQGAIPVILEKYPTAEKILKKQKADIKSVLRKRKLLPTDDFLDRLVKTAKEALPPERDSEVFLCERLKELLAQLNLISEHINHSETQMACLLASTPGVILLSIPYVGVITAAEFIGEIGPPENYPTGNQIISLAGLNPGGRQSGKWESSKNSITKQGNARLRGVVMDIAHMLSHHNPFYAEQYERLIQREKNKKDGKKGKKYVEVIVATSFLRHAHVMMQEKKLFAPTNWKGRPIADNPLKKLERFLKEHHYEKPFTEIAVSAATYLPSFSPLTEKKEYKPATKEAIVHISDVIADIKAKIDSSRIH